MDSYHTTCSTKRSPKLIHSGLNLWVHGLHGLVKHLAMCLGSNQNCVWKCSSRHHSFEVIGTGLPSLWLWLALARSQSVIQPIFCIKWIDPAQRRESNNQVCLLVFKQKHSARYHSHCGYKRYSGAVISAVTRFCCHISGAIPNCSCRPWVHISLCPNLPN